MVAALGIGTAVQSTCKYDSGPQITIESGTEPSTVQITNLLQITNTKLEKNRSNCKPINRPCNLSNLILISRLKLEAY